MLITFFSGEASLFTANETYQRALLHWNRAALQGTVHLDRREGLCGQTLLSILHKQILEHVILMAIPVTEH